MSSENIDEKYEKALQAGIASGNINITQTTNVDTNAVMMSEVAKEDIEAHEAMKKSLEIKRIQRNLKLPTDDEEVKARLRALHEPICYFGETVKFFLHIFLSNHFILSFFFFLLSLCQKGPSFFCANSHFKKLKTHRDTYKKQATKTFHFKLGGRSKRTFRCNNNQKN